jgi:nitroreductase
MDTYECIITKLDIREYSAQDVPLEIRQRILEAARSTGTGLNTQHWKFMVCCMIPYS